MKRLFGLAAIVFALSPLAGTAYAAYPERPIKIVVPFGAGGSTDIAARIIAQSMSERMKSPVVIENRPGGGSNVGTVAVAKSQPDGYTLLMNGAAMTILPSMKSDVPFDAQKEFIPISMGVRGQYTFLANPDSRFKKFEDMLAFARANPGKLNLAGPGGWTGAHFILELLKWKANIDFQIVQYNGNAPAAQAVLSGEPPIGLDAANSAKGVVEAGKLRALAVSGAQRTKVFPQVPTVAESGVPGYEAGFWLGFFAPAGTPRDIIDRLGREFAAAAKDPGVIEKMDQQGLEAVGNTPAEFAAQVAHETEQNAVIVKRILDEEAKEAKK